MIREELLARIAALKARLPIAVHKDDATELAKILREIAMLERRVKEGMN